MKTKTKLIVLFISLLGFLIVFSLLYFLIRNKEQNIYAESSLSNARQVIETVIDFKMEGLLKPVKDNSAWDEMIRFTKEKDTVWAKDILQSVMATYSMNYLGVSGLDGKLFFFVEDGMPGNIPIRSEMITSAFLQQTTVNFFVIENGHLYQICGATIVPTEDIARITMPHGFLIGVKVWDSAFLKEVSNATGFLVRFITEAESKNHLLTETEDQVLYALKDYTGRQMGNLIFTRENPYLARFDNFGYLALVAGCLMFVVTGLFFYLISKWVAKPLHAIELSLEDPKSKATDYLLEQQDEFGHIANLIKSFRKQREELLQKNIEYEVALDEIQKLTTAVDQSANTLIITDIKGNIVYVNKRFTEVTGYSAGEAIGKTPAILKSGLQEKNFYTNLWNTILKGQEWKGELANRKKDGTIFWESMSIAPIRNKEGNLVNFIAIKEDITERIQTEQALKESREFTDLIYKLIPSAIFTVDNEQRITSWNRQAEKITGYSADELIGQVCRVFALTPCAEKCGIFDKNIPKPLMGRECTIRTKSGEILSVAKNVDLLVDNTGQIIGGIESFEDITERKRTEAALIKAKEDAEIANRAKSEFLATMSHEIRTPMNGVIGMTELALTTKLTNSQRDYLQSIQTSAYLLLDTINDILDFSKIEAGRMEIESVQFNIYEVVERSVEILTVKAFDKNIELLCEIEPGMPSCFTGDPLRIRQILVNFISNAVKFTPSGEIFVYTRISSKPDDTSLPYQITFSVRDTGIGIEAEKLPHIFEQFTQADNSTTRKYGGTGLGLSISKKLVEMMGGSLEVESEPGKGSTFSFTIPLHTSKCEEIDPTLPNREIKRVLVVDDNLTNLKIMTDMLAYWGIEAEVCTSGNEAFEVLEKASALKKEFDLVILDMHMPGMDGVEVADTIRNRMLFSQNPIIFLHSSVDKDHIVQSRRELGVDQFLTKPVKMKEMYELLTMGKPRAADPSTDASIKSSEELQLGPEFTILIAEDNIINMKILNAMLVKTGVNVVTAGNGVEAVEKFLSEDVDLIFMDVHMPFKDGFQATRDIRQFEGENRHTPIVALTAIALPGDREKCLESGMDNYLSKPFKKDDLFSVLATYLKPSKA